MKGGDVLGAGVETLCVLEEARRVQPAGARARALRRAGERLGDRLRSEGAIARRIEVLAIERVPCPASVAFDGALRVPIAWTTLERRMLFVEIEIGGATQRVVVDPVEPGAWMRTPWGAWFAETHPRRAKKMRRRTLDAAIASIGIERASIDIAVVTHLRGQDLGATIGTSRGDGVAGPRASAFPRAAWIIGAFEWSSAIDPHDDERPHLVRGGMDRLDEARVTRIDRDLALGTGAALIRTPGLTPGHATFVARGPNGVLAWSSHGVAVDCWSPYHGRVPGLRARVRERDVECVTRSDVASRQDALTSMSLERAIVDRRRDQPAFHLVVPQQELVASTLLRPLASTF